MRLHLHRHLRYNKYIRFVHNVTHFRCIDCECVNCCGMLSQKKGRTTECLRGCLPLGKGDSSKMPSRVSNKVNDNRLNKNNKDNRDNERHPTHAQPIDGLTEECVDYGSGRIRNSDSIHRVSGLRRALLPTHVEDEKAVDDMIVRTLNRSPVQRRKLSLDTDNHERRQLDQPFEMKPIRRSLPPSKQSHSESHSHFLQVPSMDSMHHSFFPSLHTPTASDDGRTSRIVAQQPDPGDTEQPSSCSQRKRVFVEIGPDAKLGIRLFGRHRRSGGGVFVGEVMRGGPAERVGGIQTGDQILAINGITLNELSNKEALDVLRSQLACNRAVALDVKKSSKQGSDPNYLQPVIHPSLSEVRIQQRRCSCVHSRLNTIPEEKVLEGGVNAVLTRIDPTQRRRHSLPNQKTESTNVAMTTEPRHCRRCSTPNHKTYFADVSMTTEQPIESRQLMRYAPANQKTDRADSLTLRHRKPNDRDSLSRRRKSSENNLPSHKSKHRIPTFPEKKLFRGEKLLKDLCRITRAATELTDLRKYVTTFVKGLLASGRLVRILSNDELYQNADVRKCFSSEAFYQFTRSSSRSKAKPKVIAIC